MDIALALNIATTVAVVGGVIFGAWQIRVAAKARTTEVSLQLKTITILTSAVCFTPYAVHAKMDATFQDCKLDCPMMVVIKAGSFEMGAAPGEEEREKLPQDYRWHSTPQHLVSIKHEFAVGKYDVTRREFAAFIDATGYKIGTGCMVG